jgi:hypothetical protein
MWHFMPCGKDAVSICVRAGSHVEQDNPPGL